MKTILCSAAFCLMINLGFAQFQRSYGTEKSELGWALDQLEKVEKGYLIGGYTSQSIIGGLEATLIKTDLNGNQIWSRVYGGTSHEYFSSARQSTYFSSSNKVAYIAAGHTKSYGSGAGDAFLIGVNKNGFPEFSAVYGGREFDTFRCVQNTKDQNGKPGYIAVGNTFSYSNAFPGSNVYVVQTDPMGDIIKATVIGGKGDQIGTWIEQTKDGGYIICGYTTNYRCEGSVGLINPPEDIFIIKLKPDLTIEWNRILGYPKELDGTINYTNLATCVKQNKQGDFVVTGYTNSFGINNSNDVFLLYMSSAGNFQGMKTYGTRRDEYSSGLQETIDAAGNQRYTIVGSNTISSTYQAMLFQTDVAGNLQWARNYGKTGRESSDELVVDNFNKGFAFVGFTDSIGITGSRDIYLVETTATGKTGTSCEKEIDLKVIKHEPCVTRSAQQIFVKDYKRIEPKTIKVTYKDGRCGNITGGRTEESKTLEKEYDAFLFPNPVNDILMVSIAKNLSIKQVKIFDLQGKEVIQNIEVGKADTIAISTEALNPGIYIVKLITDHGEVYLKKFHKK